MEYRPSLHLDVVAIEMGASGSLSTRVANFTYISWIAQEYSPSIAQQ